MGIRGLVTAAVLGDPLLGRVERAEALRLSLPAPRPEQDLAQWLPTRAGLPKATGRLDKQSSP